jgi:hypothetical protein
MILYFSGILMYGRYKKEGNLSSFLDPTKQVFNQTIRDSHVNSIVFLQVTPAALR